MAIPFVQARWYYPGRLGSRIDLVVIHRMEYPNKSSAAEDCAAYFRDPRLPNGQVNKASAHYCVDNDSEVQCVKDSDTAFAAPRINHNGIHIEHAGYSAASDWGTPYGQAMLNRSAVLAAGLCRRYQIPAVWVNEQGLREGKRGITDHATATRAFYIVGGHTDPGIYFPRYLYVQIVAALLTPPPDPPEDPMLKLVHDGRNYLLFPSQLILELTGKAPPNVDTWEPAAGMWTDLVIANEKARGQYGLKIDKIPRT